MVKTEESVRGREEGSTYRFRRCILGTVEGHFTSSLITNCLGLNKKKAMTIT